MIKISQLFNKLFALLSGVRNGHSAFIVLLFVSIISLNACTTTPKPPPAPQSSLPPAPPKIALALGGGAARGFAHIGVIKTLESHGIRPNMVVGTSAGAVVGALYASGMDIYTLQTMATQLDETILADWTLPRLGVINGQALEDFINKAIGQKPMEKLTLPFAALATDLHSGTPIVFRQGNTGMAVRASASVPGIFKPTPIGGKLYVDGGLVSPVPVAAAREMGADFVIAVDISAKPEHQSTDSMMGILWQTISIMGAKISANEMRDADIVIRPNLPQVKSWDFNARNQSILEGERAAQLALPAIKEWLSQPLTPISIR